MMEKRYFVFSIILVIFLYGCEQVPEIDDKTAEETDEEPFRQPDIFEPEHETSDLPASFTNLEGNIDFLLNQGHGVGNDVYDPMLEEFKKFEGQNIPTSDLERVRDKLAQLAPGPRPAVQEYPFELFSAIEGELDNALNTGVTFSDDHHQRILNDIATLESQGVGEKELKVFRNKIGRIMTGIVPKDDLDQNLVEKLPECTEPIYTTLPADLSQIYEISPLGGIGPPGHTIPTQHMYFHINAGQSTTKIIDLKAPADIYITAIASDDDDIAPGRKEYVIRFSVCKDVHGYFNHVKELSDELELVIANVECEQWTTNPGDICQKEIFHKVSAGTVISGVGHKQGKSWIS
jgi:hypothetical protein